MSFKIFSFSETRKGPINNDITFFCENIKNIEVPVKHNPNDNENEYIMKIDAWEPFIDFVRKNSKFETFTIDFSKSVVQFTSHSDNRKNTETKDLCWKNIKTIPEGDFKEFREDFYEYRRIVVDSLLEFIRQSISNCTSSNEMICRILPSGSAGDDSTLSSDYDVTLSGINKLQTIMRIFYKVIFEIYKKSSSQVFDTNLYCHSFLPSGRKQEGTKNGYMLPLSIQGKKDMEPRVFFYYPIYETEKKQLFFEQDLFVLLRFATQLTENKQSAQINNKLFCLSNEKTNNPIISINEIETKLNVKGLTDNEKYIEKIQNYEKYIAGSLVEKPTTCKDLKLIHVNQQINLLSQANYYSDESYFTMGSFYHSVGLMLFFKDVSSEDLENLKKAGIFNKTLLAHSMLENLSYAIFSFGSKLHDSLTYDSLISETMEPFLYCSKYIHRFFDAYFRITEQKHPLLKTLKEIKSNFRNKSGLVNEKLKAVNEFFTLMNSIGNPGTRYDKSINAITFFHILFHFAKDCLESENYEGKLQIHFDKDNVPTIFLPKNEETNKMFDKTLNVIVNGEKCELRGGNRNQKKHTRYTSQKKKKIIKNDHKSCVRPKKYTYNTMKQKISQPSKTTNKSNMKKKSRKLSL